MDIDTNAGNGKQAGRRLWLVRHGCTVWNQQQRFCGRSDIPLSEEGRLQARWLANCLAAERISALYASDLLRARETAEIIAGASARTIQVQTLAAWRELDFGAWEGLTYGEIAARFPEHLGFFRDPESCSPPGGETLAQLRQRALAALAQVLQASAESSDGDIVIVSHGGPLRVLINCVLGMPLARQWQLGLDPGSLSALELLPEQDPAAPLGTLALLNMRSSLASMLSPHASHTFMNRDL
jgi:broad specificity phosphatase PhoE